MPEFEDALAGELVDAGMQHDFTQAVAFKIRQRRVLLTDAVPDTLLRASARLHGHGGLQPSNRTAFSATDLLSSGRARGVSSGMIDVDLLATVHQGLLLTR